MGGLRKHLPVTYWTFLIGSLAIAGIPGLAGFFSKDEILFETFHNGHQILWTVGILTSLLTATYMFRLVYLTFFGEMRFGDGAHGLMPPHGAAPSFGGAGAGAHAAPVSPPAHPIHLHDAPPAMAFTLIVLAIGSVFAGYLGIPHGLGGHNRTRHVARAVVRGRQLRPGRHGRDRRPACRHGARGLRTRRRRGESVVGAAPATCTTCRTCRTRSNLSNLSNLKTSPSSVIAHDRLVADRRPGHSDRAAVSG